MPKYTLELCDMLRDKNFNLFDFEYDFYCDNESLKRNFEEKFKQNYLFYEIGSETVQRFKFMLQSKLNMIMPYYKQLYETELRCKNIDFMVNKDYTETISRDLTSTMENIITSNNTGNSTSNNTSNDNEKQSSINNGVSNVSIVNGLTGETQLKSDSNSVTNTSTKENQSMDNTNKQTEVTTNTGKGNIGITSSASLLKGWREVIINIDKLIIDECYDLFMLVY